MAELTASILTLAEVSKTIIVRVVDYIREVHLVGGLIEDVLARLKELHGLIRLISDTYEAVESREGNASAKFVFKKLGICQARLEKLKPLVIGLAKLERETLREKISVKRELDKVKEEIKTHLSDIERNMVYIRDGINCWNLRISDAILTGRKSITHIDWQLRAEDGMTPMRRTLSDAGKVADYDTIVPLRRVSTTLSPNPRTPTFPSKSPPNRPYDRSDSVISAPYTAPVTSKSEWEAFYARLVNCRGDEDQLQKTYDTLRLHVDGVGLVRFIDGSGRTPLHIAAQRGDVELASILIDFGADVNAQDSEPSSVLDLAVANNKHTEFVALLLDRHVNELGIRDCNEVRFKEMKRTIDYDNNIAGQRART